MRAIVSFLQVEAQRKEVLCQVPRHEAASPSLAGMGGEGRASGRLPALVSGSPRAHPPPTPRETGQSSGKLSVPETFPYTLTIYHLQESSH